MEKRRGHKEREVDEQHVEDLGIAQAYADDQLNIIPGRSVKEIEAKWTRIWVACKKWELYSNSKYNQVKTEAMFIVKDNKAKIAQTRSCFGWLKDLF